LLLAGVLIQAALIIGRSLDDLNGVRLTLGMPALWRSAYFSQGEKFAGYVAFLNENIPVGGRVVLPPSGHGPKLVGNTPSMQFFLAPRQVINCLDLECAANLSVDNTYLLVVDDFPGDVVTKIGRQMFDEQGLLNLGWMQQARRPTNLGPCRNPVGALWPTLWLVVPCVVFHSMGSFLGFLLPLPGIGLQPEPGAATWWQPGCLGANRKSTFTLDAGLLVVSCALQWSSAKPAPGDAHPDSQAGLQDPGWVFSVAGLAASSLAKAVLTDESCCGVPRVWSLPQARWRIGIGVRTRSLPMHIPLLIAAFNVCSAMHCLRSWL
jgi:hypothetical protein